MFVETPDGRFRALGAENPATGSALTCVGAKICATLADAVAMTARTTANASTVIGRRADCRRRGRRNPNRGDSVAGPAVSRLYAESASNVAAGTARSRAASLASADVFS